jgi:hypothetical protein
VPEQIEQPATPSARDAPAGVPAPSRRRGGWRSRLALFAALVGIYVILPNSVVADSIRNVAVAESIVHRHTLQLDHFRDTMPIPGYGVDNVNGHLLPYFPWGGTVFAVPVVAVYDGLHKIGIGPGTEAKIAQSQNDDWQFEIVTMALVVGATGVVMWEVAILALAGIAGERKRRRLALVATLVFALGTSVLSTASRSYWEHGPEILCLSVALLLAVRSRTRPEVLRWLGIPLALAYVMRPTAAVPVALFTLWMVWKHRRYLPWFFGGALLVAVPWLLINHANWGSWLQPYYQPSRVGSNGEFWQALAGNMVSPARGLLIFSPVLALAVPGVIIRLRRHTFDSLDAVIAVSVFAHWIVVSTFPHWWGGDSFGPRFFTDMVPFLTYLSLPVLEWLGTTTLRTARYTAAMVACVVATVLSLFVNGQMAVFASSHCWNNVPTDVDRDTTKLWNWGDPQFLRGIVRFVSGPNPRGQETRRGGAGYYGCPWEPQVTGGPQSPPPPPAQPASG